MPALDGEGGITQDRGKGVWGIYLGCEGTYLAGGGGYLPWTGAGGTYHLPCVWGGRWYLPLMGGESTYLGGGGYLPWMEGGVLTLHGGGGTYSGLGERVPTLDRGGGTYPGQVMLQAVCLL